MDRHRQTAEVLAAMLTENTGRHMLDSGDAYGRHWQRNRGIDVESWLNRPTASWGYKGEYYTLDVFHWLLTRLQFEPELQAEFDIFDQERPDDGWLQVMDEFCEHKWPELTRECINSYNHEDALSQVIQFTGVFGDDYPDHQYVLLQIHGGCDVRGGYTAPKVFSVVGTECCMYDFMSASIGCDGFHPPQIETLPGFPDATVVHHSWWVTGGGDLIDSDGSYCETFYKKFGDDADLWDDDNGTLLCPECKQLGRDVPLRVHGD